MAHLILFDGECALCNQSVRYLLGADAKESLLFAPLQGETAQSILKEPIELDTLIFVEGFQTQKQRLWRYGKGALRICWHLGKWYRVLGLLSFLPHWVVDPLYRIIARNRHFLFKKGGAVPLESRRLLP